MKNQPSRRPTQADIARRCGVSQMAVSLALRGSPKVSAAVRHRILQVAKRLNWRPDPALSALVHYRHGCAGGRSPLTIAWVTNWPTRDGWRANHPVYQKYFDGAQAKAAKLGYQLEPFWLREPAMTPMRMSQVLYTRSIMGLLLPPQPRAHLHLRMAWNKFAAVTFGFTLERPTLHVVTNHHFRSSIFALRKLRSLGYRRVGVLLDERYDVRVDYSWTAGCLAEQRHYPPEETLPVLSLTALTPEKLRAYLRRYKPDALLTNFWNMGEWLRGLKVTVPNELGLAYLSVTERNPTDAGINENSFAIGEAAMDLLATMIRSHELGVPPVPRHIMIDGFWVNGKTVRRRGRSAPWIGKRFLEKAAPESFFERGGR